MKPFLPDLLAAQTTLLQQPPESPLRRATLVHLVDVVPAPVLAHFLRLVEHGRTGVALVRNGVCSGCHLRLPSSQAAVLLKSDGLHLCENCGAYLMLPPDGPAAPAVTPAEVAPVRQRRPRARQVVPV